MPNPSVGLYIGTDSIDLVQLSGSFQRPRWIGGHRVPLPLHSAWRLRVRAEEAGMLTKEEIPSNAGGSEGEISALIQGLLKKTQVSPKGISVAVASEAVVIRYFQMPVIPVHERRTAVSFEAKKYLPFKLEELATDFQIVIRRTDPTVMQVVFAGMKRNAMEAILAVLQVAGIQPLSVEAAPLSLMRVVRHAGQIPLQKVAVILSVERDTAVINIAKDDVLYLSRTVTVPSEGDLSQGPSKQLLDALIQETRVSIDYYRRRFVGEPEAAKILLYGRGIEQKQVQEFTSAVELPLEWADPLKQISGTRELLPGLAIAAGAALRSLDQKGILSTNLLSDRSQRESIGLLRPFLIQVCIALVILAAAFGFSYADLRSFEQSIAGIRQAQVYPAGVTSSLSLAELQSVRDKQKKQILFLQAFSQNLGRSPILLSELTQLLPKEAWLERLSLNDLMKSTKEESGFSMKPERSLEIEGRSYANNRDKELEGINGFLSALKSSPVLKKVFTGFQLDSVQRSRFKDEEVTEFRLSCFFREENKL